MGNLKKGSRSMIECSSGFCAVILWNLRAFSLYISAISWSFSIQLSQEWMCKNYMKSHIISQRDTTKQPDSSFCPLTWTRATKSQGKCVQKLYEVSFLCQIRYKHEPFLNFWPKKPVLIHKKPKRICVQKFYEISLVFKQNVLYIFIYIIIYLLYLIFFKIVFF